MTDTVEAKVTSDLLAARPPRCEQRWKRVTEAWTRVRYCWSVLRLGLPAVWTSVYPDEECIIQNCQFDRVGIIVRDTGQGAKDTSIIRNVFSGMIPTAFWDKFTETRSIDASCKHETPERLSISGSVFDRGNMDLGLSEP